MNSYEVIYYSACAYVFVVLATVEGSSYEDAFKKWGGPTKIGAEPVMVRLVAKGGAS